MKIVTEIQSVLKKALEKNPIQAEHDEYGHHYRHLPSNVLVDSVTTKFSVAGESPQLKLWAARVAVEHIKENIHLMQEGADIEAREKMLLQATIMHQDMFSEAGDVGTKGHAILEEYLKLWMDSGIRPADIKAFVKEDDYRLFAIARSGEQFCKDFNVIPVASEMFVISLRHQFGGTLDSLMMVGIEKQKGNDPLCTHVWMQRAKDERKLICGKCSRKIDMELALVDFKTSNSINKIEYASQVSSYWYALREMTGIRTKKLFILRLDKKKCAYEVMQVADPVRAFRAALASGKVHEWREDKKPKLIPFPEKKIISIV